MRRSLAAAVLAAALAACGSAKPSGPNASDAPFPGGVSPAATTAATPRITSAPQPTPELGWAIHIVAALDHLAALPASSDGVSQWAVDESRWTIDNIGAGSGLFGKYSLAMLDLLQAIQNDAGVADAVKALLALRADIAALAPGAVPAEPPASQVAVDGFGFTYYPVSTKYVQYGVVMRNPNLTGWFATDVRVNITFLSADGSVAGSEDESVSLVPPGLGSGKGRVFAVGGVSFVEASVTKMEVTVHAGLEATDSASFGDVTFSGVKTTSDAYGTTTSGRVTSSYVEELKYAEVVAIYRNSAGKIVGGDSTLIDVLPNGDTKVSFKIDTLGKIPHIATVDLYVNP